MATELHGRIRELEGRQDHVGVVQLCSEMLTQQLSSQDRVLALRKWGQHLAALNPEAWISQIVSAFNDALDECIGDPILDAQLLAALAAAVVPLGIPSHIEETLQRFNSLASSHPKPEIQKYAGDIMYNLGRSYEAAGHYPRAAENYLHAVESFRSSGQSLKIGWALHNLAHVKILMGQVVDAKSLMEEAHQLMPIGAEELCLQGKVAHAQGDFSTAQSLFEAAITDPGNTERSHVSILAAWAETDLALGNLDGAHQRAREALEIAYRLPYREAVVALKAFLTKLNGGGNN